MAGSLDTASLDELLEYCKISNLAREIDVQNVNHIVPNVFEFQFQPSAPNLSAQDKAAELVTAWQAKAAADRASFLRMLISPVAWSAYVAGATPSVTVRLMKELKLQQRDLDTARGQLVQAMGDIPAVAEFITNGNAGSLSKETQDAVNRARVLVSTPEGTVRQLFTKLDVKSVPEGTLLSFG
jgi:hypothetical protein